MGDAPVPSAKPAHLLMWKEASRRRLMQGGCRVDAGSFGCKSDAANVVPMDCAVCVYEVPWERM